jgi:hypothetical protein
MRPSPLILSVLSAAAVVHAAEPFDGRPWNVSTGNLSVNYIQASPIGAHPRPDVIEPPPSLESQVAWKKAGLVANEDYVAWGSVEREPGKWVWQQHDAVEKLMHAAGLKYVIYDWAHFPPVWLREGRKAERTLMRCLEHDRETNYLSVFDPRTIAWYEHFYKNVHAHFGDKVDDMYACILGPYGEGNYPLNVPDWVNIGHCHEGYWAADPYAVQAFQVAMKQRYMTVAELNKAWGAEYKSFDDVRPPKEVTGTDKYKITPALFPTPEDRRRWLDFITWYHQAIIDFSEQSVRALLRYYPHEKVRLKPGGTAHGINPVAWGTYSPGYAKMAAPYDIVLQPADCIGAVFGDKWLGTAYAFYGVKLGTEPAGSLDKATYVRRMFSDASCGASQHFTYEFQSHIPEIQKYIHLYIGKPGETEIALHCPTTLYRLGGDVQLTIQAAYPLRDLCEFDVLDELLIRDGALTPDKYKVLLMTQPEIIDQPILDKIDAYRNAGGKIILVGNPSVANVEGAEWNTARRLPRVAELNSKGQWLRDLAPLLAGYKGCDGKMDGLWTCRRGDQTMVFNSTANPVTVRVGDRDITVEGHEIWTNK